jgi:prolipoprotein diacylglyceryltransferase
MSAKKKSPNESPRIEAARLVDILYKAEYFDKKSFYLHSFMRGLVAGAGGVIGATLLVAILLAILSLFDTIPLIGPLVENARETIQKN